MTCDAYVGSHVCACRRGSTANGILSEESWHSSMHEAAYAVVVVIIVVVWFLHAAELRLGLALFVAHDAPQKSNFEQGITPNSIQFYVQRLFSR
jgi:hypothetical protein